MCETVDKVQSIKCMIIGDSLTGKTHLFKKLTNQTFPTEYVPTVFDVCNVEVTSKRGCCLTLNLWDSSGSHIYDSIRPISYAHVRQIHRYTQNESKLVVTLKLSTDCFIVCYSIDDKSSYENIYLRWLPEIREHGDGPTVPTVLVATKCDLARCEENDGSCKDKHEYVREAEGRKMQEKIRCNAFFSCSALTETQVRDILQTSIELAQTKKEEELKPSDPIWKFCSSTVVIMGDSGVGKSSLIQACTKHPFKSQLGSNPEKKLQEHYHAMIVDGCEYFLRFVEVPSEKDLNTTLIKQVDVLIFCYAVNDPFSFQTVELIQSRLSQQELNNCPHILIGTKNELKTESLCTIPTIDGELLRQKMKCVAFIECSARTLENVPRVLEVILDNINNSIP